VGRKKGQEMSAEEFLLQEWSLMFSIACPISSSRRSHILITEALPLSRVQAFKPTARHRLVGSASWAFVLWAGPWILHLPPGLGHDGG